MRQIQPLPEQLGSYPAVIEIPVAWGEMDAFGHVNNVNFFRYFESARVHYFEKIELLSQMKITGIGAVVASTECRYFLPIKYPDTIWVGSKITKIQQNSLVMEYEIVSQNKMKTCAKGSAKMVMFDFNAQQKTDIPEALIKKINLFQAI